VFFEKATQSASEISNEGLDRLAKHEMNGRQVGIFHSLLIMHFADAIDRSRMQSAVRNA